MLIVSPDVVATTVLWTESVAATALLVPRRTAIAAASEILSFLSIAFPNTYLVFFV
jgi:hypothetical protein